MTTVAVEICACGHAARMHARDFEAEDGRGVCAHRSCGCAEYRPASVEVQQPAVEPVVEPVVEPDTASARAARPVAEEFWACTAVGCFRSFTSPQGLAMHRRRAHEGFDPNKPDQGTQTGPAAGAPTAAAPAPPADTQPLEEAASSGGPLTVVHPDDVLVGLVRALEAVITADASALLVQALDIRQYMNDRGWRVIDASPATPTTTTGATP